MANGSRDVILKLLLNGDRFSVLLLGAIEVILLLQGFAKMLMSKPNKSLLIAHFIECKASHQIFTGHNQLPCRLVALAYLHILLSKAPAVAIHSLNRLERLVIERNGFLQVPMPEVVIS